MESSVRYPGQPSDEVTRKVVYKHVMAIAPIIFGLVLVVLAFIVAVVYYNSNESTFENILSPGLVSVIGFLVLMIISLLVLGSLWIWRRNKIVVTDFHLVDIDQIGLFNTAVSTLHLNEIQDITAKINGPIQHIFRYGTIIVQTAGERENFIFDFVPFPYDLERYILDLRKGGNNLEEKSK